MPETLAECGFPGALSAITSEALRVPVPVGLKVTEMLVLAPAAIVIGEATVATVLVANSLAFGPVNDSPVIFIGAVPVLVTVRFCGELVVPTLWPGNVSGDSGPICGAMPVPVSDSEFGPLVALSMKLRVAVSLLPVDGVKTIVSVAVPLFFGTVSGKVGAGLSTKSAALAPVTLKNVMLRSAPPELV
ncbi:MAG: hypothetical protein WA463_11245, partial [Terriglobales bacterium]